MLRVVAVMTREQHKAGMFRMHKFPVTAFAAMDSVESGAFKVGDPLANLARHTTEIATALHPLPTSIPASALSFDP